MGKKSKLLVWSTIILSIISVPLFVIWLPTQIDNIVAFTKAYPLFGPIFSVLWTVLSIVIPPIPGGLLLIALIPVFGWWQTFIYKAIGVIIGTTISFFLARRFREPLVKKFVPLQQLNEWESKISERTQFFAFLGIRLTTGSVMDFISYIAGLSKISYTSFILATIISLWSDFVLYYVGGKVFQKSAYITIGITLIFVTGFFIAKKLKFFKLK